MSRNLMRLASTVTLALLLGVGAGLARASVVSLDDLAGAQLIPSAEAPLLGPINELGRNGWHCLPEQAARATTAAKAELPDAGR